MAALVILRWNAIGACDMMDQFRVRYIPGGMGLDHSAWWLCQRELQAGMYVDRPVLRLRKSDY